MFVRIARVALRVACLCVLVGGSSAAFAAEQADAGAKKETKTETWYKVILPTQPWGCLHSVVEEIEYDGQPARHDVERLLLRDMETRKMGQYSSEETWSTLDGRLLKYIRNENEDVTTVVVDGAKIVVTKTVNGKETPVKTIDIPQGTTVSIGADEATLKQMGFKAGEKREFTIFSVNSMSLVKETVTAAKTQPYVQGGRNVQGYLYQIVDSDAKGIIVEWILSTDFEIVYMKWPTPYGAIECVKFSAADAAKLGAK